MNKSIIKSFAFLSILATLSISSLIVSKADDNGMTTGGIQIQTYVSSIDEHDASKRAEFKNGKTYVPSNNIAYRIEVKNVKSESWIRLKFSMKADGINPDDSWLQGIDTTKWKKYTDGYWYYNKKVGTGEYVEFCNSIKIPDQISVGKDTEVDIVYRAEAIQAKHVSPNFNSNKPFDGFEIESTNGVYESHDKIKGFSIVYKDGADTIVDANNIFTDMNELMPGDKKSETVKITNNTNKNVKVYLKEYSDTLDSVLDKQVKLKIKKDGNDLYYGSLADDMLRNGLYLGVYNKQQASLEFILELPLSMKNETAFKKSNVTLEFSVKTDRNSNNTSGGHGGGSGSSKNYIYVHDKPDGSLEKGGTGGQWKLIDEKKHIWNYELPQGGLAKNGWIYLYNPWSTFETKSYWFYFDEQGIMQYGWIKDKSGNWYFCHDISDGNLGYLQKGWHNDKDDKRTYYLDPVTYIMKSGWQEIDNKWYYFARSEDINRQNWFWFIGEMPHWVYDLLGFRTYGSMYINEVTPDGNKVNNEGVWINE